MPVTRLPTDLTFLCYLEEPKTTKTAGEYYNGGKEPATRRSSVYYKSADRMEVVGCGREKGLRGRLDTMLTFVCLALFAFRSN